MAIPDTSTSSEDFDEFADLASAEAGISPSSPARELMIVGTAADSTLVVKQLRGGTSKTLTVPPLVRMPTAIVGLTAAGSTLGAGGKIQVFR